MKTLGTWLLETAAGGKARFALDVLACLDGLPIGMAALKGVGIGKTVSKAGFPRPSLVTQKRSWGVWHRLWQHLLQHWPQQAITVWDATGG